MKTEFRNRAFLPIMMPLMILGTMAAVIGLFAWILLYNTSDGALVLAGVMATGILVSLGLAASADELGPRHKAGVGLALLVPILFGAGLAATGGGTDDVSALNINREPHIVIPEVNVEVVALNSAAFEQTSLTLPSAEVAAIVFDNEESGVPHNVAVKAAGADGGAPDNLNDPLFATAIVPGVATTFVEVELEAGAYWFWCQVHPNMNGQLTAEEGAEPAAA